MLPDIQTLTVALGERSYDIVIGAGLLRHAADYVRPLLPYSRVIILSDENVATHYLQPLTDKLAASDIRCDSIVVPAGEGSKSFAQFESVMNDLLACQPDRKTTLIALGGGVVGDLCGFAASVLLRGVPFIQIPTSLLAQVDSSVGGKTAINAKSGKNLVGSFYQPKAVLIDTDTLNTLPDRELKAGYAEVAKYGLIADASFFKWLANNQLAIMARDKAALTHAIHTSCQAKATIVAEDEKEGGMRALLNLGHTFGHALEAETGYGDRLLHGEAVAIGMVMAARLSCQLGLAESELEAEVADHLKAAGLPTTPKDVQLDWDIDAFCHHFFSDKKTEAGELTFILLERVGKAVISKGVAAASARQVVVEVAT